MYQRRADVMRQTYEIIHPRDMTHEQVLDCVTACISQLPHPRFLRPAYAVSFEKFANAEGKHYYLHMPGHVHIELEKLVRRKIKGAAIIEIPPADDLVLQTPWTESSELGMKGLLASLNIDKPEHLATTIDAHFDDLEGDQALVLQFVVIPGHPHEPQDSSEKEKLSGHTLHAVARVGASGFNARTNMANLRGTFRGTNSQGSRFHKRLVPGVADRIIRRAGTTAYPIFFNVREFAGFISWLSAGGGLPPSSIIPTTGIVVAAANAGRSRPLAIPVSKFNTHAWIIGPTDSGKSALLHNMAQQLAESGRGFALIEPKGDLARDVLNSIPENRINDVCYFDPADEANPIGFNMLAGPDPYKTAAHLVALFKKKFKDSWGPRLEMFMRLGVYTTAVNDMSIFEVKEMMRNAEWRRPFVRKLDEFIQLDWRDVENSSDSAVYPITNKIDAFTNTPMIRNIVGQVTGGINMRDIILGNKILLVPLDPIAVGAINAEILGEMLVDQIWATMRSIPEHLRRPFPLIVDELQKFTAASEDVEEMLAMARSYQMPFIGAHQYTGQLKRANDHLLPALENNARTKIVFAPSSQDAGVVAQHFPPLTKEDLQEMPRHGVAIRMMTEAGLAPTVTGITYPPPEPSGFGARALAASRATYSRPREDVESEIKARYGSVTDEPVRIPFGQREE